MNCIECGDNLITGLNGDVCISCLECAQHKEYQEEQSTKYDLKHALANSLQALKVFEVGYTSETNDAMVVEHNGNVFILHLEKTDSTLSGAVNYLSGSHIF